MLTVTKLSGSYALYSGDTRQYSQRAVQRRLSAIFKSNFDLVTAAGHGLVYFEFKNVQVCIAKSGQNLIHMELSLDRRHCAAMREGGIQGNVGSTQNICETKCRGDQQASRHPLQRCVRIPAELSRRSRYRPKRLASIMAVTSRSAISVQARVTSKRIPLFF
jgi:hypothetical protein